MKRPMRVFEFVFAAYAATSQQDGDDMARKKAQRVHRLILLRYLPRSSPADGDTEYLARGIDEVRLRT